MPAKTKSEPLSKKLSTTAATSPSPAKTDRKLKVISLTGRVDRAWPNRWCEFFPGLRGDVHRSRSCVAGHGHQSGPAWDRRQRLVRSQGGQDGRLCRRLPLPACAAAPKREGAGREGKGSETRRKERGAGSPERLLGPTLADALKEATGGKGRGRRAVAQGPRRRAARRPQRPDACYWFDTDDGQFVTSTYYRDARAPLGRGVQRRPAGRPLVRQGLDAAAARPRLREATAARTTCRGEGKGVAPGPHLPAPDGRRPEEARARPTTRRCTTRRSATSCCWTWPSGPSTPRSSARATTPDLLCVSFSSNDPVGHTWGPDSQEVLDVTLRSDRIVKELLDASRRQGRQGPLRRWRCRPTTASARCRRSPAKQGKDAGGSRRRCCRGRPTEFLAKKFGGKPRQRQAGRDAASTRAVYLNHAVDQGARPASRPTVEEALAGWLEKQPGIQAAYTPRRNW